MSPFLALLGLLLLGQAGTGLGGRGCGPEVGVVTVLHEGEGLDKEFQRELLKATFISLSGLDRGDLRPEFIDLSSSGPQEVVVRVRGNCSGGQVVISLLGGGRLAQFASLYEQRGG